MSKELPSCSGCEHEYECVNLVCFYELLEKEKQKIRADAIDELIEMMKPCNNCPLYPNACNYTDYFEDCCRTEQSISWEDLRKLAEQLKEQSNE